MSLGLWPALKESRVFKMVTREEGKATAQAALKFLGARQAVGWVGRGLPAPWWKWAGLQGPALQGLLRLRDLGARLRPLLTCPPLPFLPYPSRI